MQKLSIDINTVRKDKTFWFARFSCAFLQTLPSSISLPQPIIVMPLSVNQDITSVVSSTPKCQTKEIIPTVRTQSKQTFIFRVRVLQI